MSESYTRKCRFCGRQINMRKMPAGQWVAFEGYDTIHDCQKPVARKKYVPDSRSSNPYGDIGFGEFDTPGGLEARVVSQTQTRPKNSSPQASPTTYPYKQTKKTNWGDGCFWIIAIWFFLQLISSCS